MIQYYICLKAKNSKCQPVSLVSVLSAAGRDTSVYAVCLPVYWKNGGLQAEMAGKVAVYTGDSAFPDGYDE